MEALLQENLFGLAQQDQITSLGQQVSLVGGTRDSVLPLLLQMADSLGQFVKLDLPYRLDDRLAKVQAVRAAISTVDSCGTISFCPAATRDLRVR